MHNILSSLCLLAIIAACATEVPNHSQAVVVAQEPTNEDLTNKIEPKTLFEGEGIPSFEELVAAGNIKEVVGDTTNIPKPQKMRTDNLTLVGLGGPVKFTELQKDMDLAGLEVANAYEAVWYANAHPGYAAIQHDRNYMIYNPLLVIKAAADGSLILDVSGEHQEIYPAGQSVLIHIPDGVDFGHGGS